MIVEVKSCNNCPLYDHEWGSCGHPAMPNLHGYVRRPFYYEYDKTVWEECPLKKDRLVVELAKEL